MQRRKFIAGLGSLAAGGAAAMGTGAFTSVSANRTLNVQVADDASALLALEAAKESGTTTKNAGEYVNSSGNAVSISLQWDGNGDGVSSSGVNDNAYTIIRNLLDITNQGSQGVYVYATGVPDGISMFQDDSDTGTGKFEGPEGPGDVKGAFSTSSTIKADDIDGDNDPKGNAGYQSAPHLGAGETLENIGLSVKSSFGNSGFNGNITIHALSQDEVNRQEGE